MTSAPTLCERIDLAAADGRRRLDALRGKLAERTLVSAGLSVQGDDGRLWDRFRDRVMIPIRSSRGSLIAFGGRTLGDDPAKYLNSPETPLFTKSQTLFALDRAARAFAKAERCLVVEGYFDCIALHAAGFAETVATLGTALTEHHAQELARRGDVGCRILDKARERLFVESRRRSEQPPDRGVPGRGRSRHANRDGQDDSRREIC